MFGSFYLLHSLYIKLLFFEPIKLRYWSPEYKHISHKLQHANSPSIKMARATRNAKTPPINNKIAIFNQIETNTQYSIFIFG